MLAKKQSLMALEFSDLSNSDFVYFSDLIFSLAGIRLTESKKELLVSRIRSHIQSIGLSGFGEYREHLEKLPQGSAELQVYINLLTTNKTDFFREPKHFDFLRNYLKSSSESSNINVWCCASSTGEEPYTLSFVLKSALHKRNYKILATDIDTEVLSAADNGVYSIAKLNEIPEEYQKEGVILGREAISGWFKVADAFKEKIQFKQHNLMDESYPSQEKFDFIFCRNVLIYFSPETVQCIARKLHGALKKDGILFIGHSESIQSAAKIYEQIQPSIYRRIR